MHRRALFPASPALALAVLLLNPFSARAAATASAQLSFSNLQITPAAGTFQLAGDWQGAAFAQAGEDAHVGSGASATADAAGDYSLGHGEATAPAAPGLNVYGLGSANASVPGLVTASDQSAGRGTVVDQFSITGGSGAVNATLSLQISGMVTVDTDVYGESAEAETILALQLPELDANPVLFDDELLSVDSNTLQNQPFSTTLNAMVTLQYNTVYTVYLEADAEAMVSNVPEPGAGVLAMAGLAALLLVLKGRGARIFRWAAAAGILSAGVSQAMYIGGEAPDVCQTCGSATNRQTAGAISTSLTEGNLREDFPVATLQGAAAPTLDFSLTYNSYNADGSRAQVDSGMGIGWTHSYNIFLFQQRGSFFRMGADGRVTLFRWGGGTSYTADTGYFETLIAQLDGSYIITNKLQSWWRFASVTNTPFLVAGPVYRLIQMGDRNQNLTTLTYSNGLLVQVTDTYGRSVSLGYTNQSKLAAITDPLGRTTQIQYDPQFRTPVRITDPAGNVVRYSYNSLYQLTRKIDRDGRNYLYLFRRQRPWAVVDGNGQPLLSLSNPGTWEVNRLALAETLRRYYVPSTTTNTDGDGNIWRYQYDQNGYISQTIAPDGSTTRYGYDPGTLQLSAVTNANGAVTRYQYDTEGNRTNMTDALGNVTTYTYDPVFNEMTSTTDPNGRVTTYQYDSQGNRTNATDSLGHVTSYTYDTRGDMLSMTDRNGHATTYSYDSFGNRTNVTDSLGNTTSYSYDAVGNVLTTVDPLGHTTRYQYDALDRVVGVTNALGGATTYTYDALGRQTSVTDPNTNTTSYQYDARGRLTQSTDSLGGVTRYSYDLNDNRVAVTNQLGHATTYGYDSLNRVAGVTNALGGVTRYTYDPVGNRIGVTDPNTNTTTYTYDALNRRIAMMDPLGGVTTYDYSAALGPPCCSPTIGSSLVTRMEDPDGNVTYYHYDELDRQVQVVRKNSDSSDVINPTDAVTSTTYDAVGNAIAVTNPIGNTTVYTYDDDNRRISAVDPVGDTTITSYDADGNILTMTAPNGNTTTNVYDALNRVTAVHDELGQVSVTAYDPDGNILSSTDPLGNTTTYQYDGLNRQVGSVDPLGRISTNSYDADGNLISSADRNLHTTSYYYDSLDRRVEVMDPLGYFTTTAYDADGNIIAVTDANGHATTYTYDALNRRIATTDPLGQTTVYSYDPAGNLTNRTDAAGQVTVYSYSALYYLTNRAYSGGANDSLSYDLDGRMLSATRDGWMDVFAYDAADRLTNASENGRTLTYTYDTPGRAQTNVYPSGRTLSYAYDARSRLVTLQDGSLNPPVASYSYDAANRVTGRDYRNGTTASYSYDADNRVISIEHSNSLGRIAGFGYAYDNENNRNYEEKRDNAGDSATYSYDSADRLTNYETGTLVGSGIPLPLLAKAWTLDPAGNWSSMLSNSVTEVRVHDAANELTTINATNHLAYDADGNLQQDPGYAYFYDEENRLTGVEQLSDSSFVEKYYYDALGRCVAQIESPPSMAARTNYYYYDDLRIIEERDDVGGLQALYVYGNYLDELLTMERGGQTYYYHQNAMWSPHALTDSSGAVAERYRYDAYGDVTVLDAGYAPLPLNAWGTAHSAVGNRFLFTGREFQEGDGLYLFRARAYSDGLGRFLERDPLEDVDGPNSYLYLRDNPAVGTDPRGWQGLGTKLYGTSPGDIGSRGFDYANGLVNAYLRAVKLASDLEKECAERNRQEHLRLAREWLNNLDANNRSIVEHYLKWFKRMPTAAEGFTAKPFVPPAKDRYVIKEQRWIYAWYAKPFCEGWLYCVDTKTGKTTSFKGAGGGETFYKKRYLPGLFTKGYLSND